MSHIMNAHWKKIIISVPISMIRNGLLNAKCDGGHYSGSIVGGGVDSGGNYDNEK